MERRNKSKNTSCKEEKEKIILTRKTQSSWQKKSNTPAFDKLKAAQSRAQQPSSKKATESKSDSDMKSMRKTALNNISPGMLKPKGKKKK